MIFSDCFCDIVYLTVAQAQLVMPFSAARCKDSNKELTMSMSSVFGVSILSSCLQSFVCVLRSVRSRYSYAPKRTNSISTASQIAFNCLLMT